MQTVVPEVLADVPVEKILELRETFPEEFHRFRAHVGDRFTELEDKLRSIKLIPRRVRVWLKADAVRESPVGWLFRTRQALR